MKHYQYILYVLFALAGLLLAGCGGKQSDSEADAARAAADSADAQKYMHHSTREELIARFEAAERDSWQKPAEVVHLLGDMEGKTVADLGAGSGYFAVRLAKEASRVIAMDVSAEFLSYIQQRADTMALHNLETRHTKPDDPMLKENEADVLLTVNTYHHIKNRPEFFGKVLEGLKPGGKLYVIDFLPGDMPHGPPPEIKVAPATARYEIKEAGFKNVRIDTTLLDFQYVITAEK